MEVGDVTTSSHVKGEPCPALQPEYVAIYCRVLQRVASDVEEDIRNQPAPIWEL